MKTLRLRRDASLPEKLDPALDQIGVQDGEEFVVSSRGRYEVGALDRNKAVLGKVAASRAAAQRVWPTTGTARWKVVKALMGGPLTRKAIYAKSGVKQKTADPRVLEAMDDGWIRQCQAQPFVDGKELLELTEAGRAAMQRDMATLPPEPEPTLEPPAANGALFATGVPRPSLFDVD